MITWVAWPAVILDSRAINASCSLLIVQPGRKQIATQAHTWTYARRNRSHSGPSIFVSSHNLRRGHRAVCVTVTVKLKPAARPTQGTARHAVQTHAPIDPACAIGKPAASAAGCPRTSAHTRPLIRARRRPQHVSSDLHVPLSSFARLLQ